MMKFILRLIVIALSVLGASYLIAGIEVRDFQAAVLFALILALINVLIKPLINLFSLPIKILTLGLFSFIINAVIFWLAARFISGVDVESFWAAFWGALVVWAVSVIANTLLKNKKKKKE